MPVAVQSTSKVCNIRAVIVCIRNSDVVLKHELCILSIARNINHFLADFYLCIIFSYILYEVSERLHVVIVRDIDTWFCECTLL